MTSIDLIKKGGVEAIVINVMKPASTATKKASSATRSQVVICFCKMMTC